MTDKKSNESRRKLLKSIAAGGGAVVAGKSLPESWSRPVVDSVMLPAHAATSAYSYTLRETENVTFGRFMAPESNSLLAGLIPDAHAGFDFPEQVILDYCVDVVGQAWRAAVRMTTEEGCLIAIWWTGGTIGSGKQTMEYKVCGEAFEPPHITFEVTGADASVAIVKILEGGDPFGPTSIPVGSCPFGDPMAEQCCEIAGDYCGTVGTRRGIEITVDPDGEITIAVEETGGYEMAYASVNPFCGGYFDVELGATRRITGTVNCGETEISGTITGGRTYTATLGACD